jgi:uncharacterized protein with beta-barrel porin domain
LGAIATGGTNSTNSGTLSGGSGGAGGAGTFFANGGGGGDGGNGALLTNTAATFTNSGAVTGGNAGPGGVGGIFSGIGGNGGNGGVGVETAGTLFTNTGTVTAGNGGEGGMELFVGTAGNGGNGGNAVLFTTTGATFINSGTVTAGNGSAAGLAGSFVTPGTVGVGGIAIVGSGLTVINSGTIIGGLAGDGLTRNNAISFTGGTNVLELQAGSSIIGNVVAFSTADTFRLGGTANASFDVSQIGPAAQYQGFGIFQKTGSSTWTLTGTNGGALATTVSAGTLVVNGTLNASTLGVNGGTLAGTGTITAPSVIVNGTIAPGPVGGIGTLNVTGAFAQNAGSTFQVNTAGAASNHLQIAGPATINGGTVVVNGSGTTGVTYTILTATGGVAGTYAGAASNTPFINALLSYDANDVFLTLAVGPNGILAFPQSFNQASVATALNTIGVNPAFTPLFSSFAGMNAAQIRFALDQLSGEIYASNLTAGLENQSLFLRTLAARLRQSNDCLCGTCAAAPGFEADDTWHAWGTPFGQAGKATDNGNAHGFEFDSVGFAAGADRWLSGDTLIGFAAGYDNWQNNTDLLGSRTNVNSFLLGLYAYQQLGDGWLLGTVSYENDSYDTTRPIDFLGASARGNYSGNQVGSYLEAGYGIGLGGVQVQPIGAIQYISLWQNSVSESGAGAVDLNVAGERVDSFRSYLGGRLLYPLNVRCRCLLPEARAFWVHEYAADTRNISNQFEGGGPNFLIYGQNLGRDWGDFGVGFSMQLGDWLRVGLHYDAFVTPDAVAHGGWGQVQVWW